MAQGLERRTEPFPDRDRAGQHLEDFPDGLEYAVALGYLVKEPVPFDRARRVPGVDGDEFELIALWLARAVTEDRDHARQAVPGQHRHGPGARDPGLGGQSGERRPADPRVRNDDRPTRRRRLAGRAASGADRQRGPPVDRKSKRLNSSHGYISYAVFCLKKKKQKKYVFNYKKKIKRFSYHKIEQ